MSVNERELNGRQEGERYDEKENGLEPVTEIVLLISDRLQSELMKLNLDADDEIMLSLAGIKQVITGSDSSMLVWMYRFIKILI